jgi:4-hydroxybenzoyl-CoA reductase subunit beta
LRLPKFDYFAVKVIEEALKLLNEHQSKARVMAGGTDLLPLLKQRVIHPLRIINIKGIPGLNVIRFDPQEGLTLSALCTLCDLNTFPLIRERFPVLAEAAGLVGSPQIRNMATLGGNICQDTRCFYYNQSDFWRKSLSSLCIKFGGKHCHVVRKSERCQAVYSSDMGPVLMAMGSEVRVCSLKGERIIPMVDFFTYNGKTPTILQPNEILTHFRIPPLDHWGGAYLKFRLRKTIDFPLVSAAAIVAVDPSDGRCISAGVAVGGVASGPVWVKEAPEILTGKRLEKKLAETVGEAAFHVVNSISNVGSSPLHRRKVSRKLVERAILQAWSSIKNSKSE